jgi:hypothetical protein
MENKDSQNSQVRSNNFEPLPESKSKFWEHAEIHTDLSWQTKEDAAKEVRGTLTEHYFVRIPGHQAQCTHCNWGFQLDSGDRVRDGHLYDKLGELVI